MSQKELLLTLWNRCNNRCAFCYNKGYYHFPLDIKAHLRSCADILHDDKVDEYSCIRLVGGEIFDGAIDSLGVRNEFDDIVETLKSDTIKAVNIITNLIYDDLGDLYFVLNQLMGKITLSTSYDPFGRFASKKNEEVWWKNLKQIQKDFPDLNIDIGINITQPLIENITKELLDDFQDRVGNCYINFNQLFTGIDGKAKEDCDFFPLFPKRRTFLRFVRDLVDWGYIKNLSESKKVQLVHFVFDKDGVAHFSETDSTFDGCEIKDGYVDSEKSMQSDIERIVDGIKAE